jgi:hypothetical protein
MDNKKLLLSDLYGRLPYGVEMHDIADDEHLSTILIGIVEDMVVLQDVYDYTYADVEDYRPYLFPLSSMTEEQKKEFPGEVSILNAFIDGSIYLSEDEELTPEDLIEIFDFLNKNHFDYRGLIKKGLALDATGLNIY